MIRKFTISFALAAACFVTGQVSAQTGETSKAVSAKQNIEMASYGRNYVSAQTASCPSCSSGGGYSYGGYANAGGPNAMAYGRIWGGAQSDRQCAKFYHYPYVYYPQNYMGDDYYRSSDSLYYRYPQEMQIPVYNRHWHNYYPSSRRYHWGHHFILDVF